MSERPLAEPRIRIAPSLLAADFSRLKDQVAIVEEAGAEVLHLDVMDGHFVPNISFGVPVIESLRPGSKLFFDVHLMISEPHRYAEAFAKAGADLITFHIEVADEPRELASHIRSLGSGVGVCLNPTTPVSAVAEVLPDVDLVLVMSVWPGFGGQAFMPEVLPKVRELKQKLTPRQRLEIDGGIDPTTIVHAVTAGADTIVAGSSIFGQPNPVAAMKELERAAHEAAPKPSK
ncbi:MAG: ribulose-phosphate 3-epimerase [Phycisphaerae bacterium]